MSSAEAEFWAAFDYDNDNERWRLREGLAPMDVLVICLRKVEADKAAIAGLLRGRESRSHGLTDDDA